MPTAYLSVSSVRSFVSFAAFAGGKQCLTNPCIAEDCCTTEPTCADIHAVRASPLTTLSPTPFDCSAHANQARKQTAISLFLLFSVQCFHLKTRSFYQDRLRTDVIERLTHYMACRRTPRMTRTILAPGRIRRSLRAAWRTAARRCVACARSVWSLVWQTRRKRQTRVESYALCDD